MSQAERDAIDIFWLLYPMLSGGQKETSEARTARELSERYQQFSQDSGKIAGFDQLLNIVKHQIRSEVQLQPSDDEGKVASRLNAYEMIVRQLIIAHALDDVRDLPNAGNTPAPLSAAKSNSQKTGARNTPSQK